MREGYLSLQAITLYCLACWLLAGSAQGEDQAEEISPQGAVNTSEKNAGDGSRKQRNILNQSIQSAASNANEMLELGRDTLSKNYRHLITSVDKFFAGDKVESDLNESYLKIDIRHSLFEHESDSNDIRLKAKVDLPGTEKRLRLFFDTDLDINNSLSERTEEASAGQDIERQNSALALEYAKKRDPFKWHSSTRLGAKMNKVPVIFINHRLQKQWRFSDTLGMAFRQEFWYLDRTGFGETTTLRFDKRLSDNISLRTLTIAELRDEEEPFEFLHLWIYQYRWKKSSLDYRIGHRREEEHDGDFSEHFTQFIYRRQLPNTWAYLSFIPSYSNEYNYDLSRWETQGSFTTRLELLFD